MRLRPQVTVALALLGLAGGSCEEDCDECMTCSPSLCEEGNIRCCPGATVGAWDELNGHCVCGPCEETWDCPTGDLCIAGSCRTAWGLDYDVTVVSGFVPAHAPDDSTWDADGSAADPYVTVEVDGATVLTTRVVDDSREPAWNETVEATLFPSTAFHWTVWDADDGDDQVILDGTADRVDLQWLRAGTAEFTNYAGTARLTFSFVPR